LRILPYNFFVEWSLASSWLGEEFGHVLDVGFFIDHIH